AAVGLLAAGPTSTTAAPSATRRRAWATAAAGSANRPPSENESWVRLTMPTSCGGIARVNDADSSCSTRGGFGGGAGQGRGGRGGGTDQRLRTGDLTALHGLSAQRRCSFPDSQRSLAHLPLRAATRRL